MLQHAEEIAINHRLKLMAAAVFVIAADFAAQPTSMRHGTRQGDGVPQREPWAPGVNALMSAHDATAPLIAPPR